MKLLAAVGVLFTAWGMTRHLNNADQTREGNPLSWIGWGIVAILTSSVPYITAGLVGVFDWGNESAAFWSENIFLLVIVSLISLFLVFGTAKAIDQTIDPWDELFTFWSRHFWSLVLSAFTISAALRLIESIALLGWESIPISPWDGWLFTLGYSIIQVFWLMIDTAFLVACVQIGLVRGTDAQLPPEAELS